MLANCSLHQRRRPSRDAARPREGCRDAADASPSGRRHRRFWMSIGLFFMCFGYPLLRLRAHACARSQSHGCRTTIHPARSPSPTAVRDWPARLNRRGRYNEASSIEARLENSGARLPPDRLEDSGWLPTAPPTTRSRRPDAISAPARARAAFTRRRAAGCPQRARAAASGDIVLFADARQRFASNTLRAIVADFNDSSVGPSAES